MTATAMNRLVCSIRRSVDSELLGELSDHELLQQVNSGDSAALGAIVRRHGGMVLAAARSVLTQEGDIEDAFQATFLALWCDGRRIRRGTSLGPWLFGVARRSALKALARSHRWRQIQSPIQIKCCDQVDPSWREVCGILYEEIDRLPEHLRGPVVMCYLEGQSRDEAAENLGWGLATLRGRLERGRDMLRRRLVRRGAFRWLSGLVGRRRFGASTRIARRFMRRHRANDCVRSFPCTPTSC
jgi:RNA polymerase sigma factor (sigma-70 family)